MTAEPRVRRALVLRSLTALAVLGVLGGCSATDDAPTRQEGVAARGAEVMPFDLAKTTHHFTPKADGLREEVIADDPSDTTQIRLIREHLSHEADRFTDGDFGDPSRIHGKNMPGLTELSAGAQRISISFRELKDGAAIDFRTSDAELITALHAWGEAQISDHGAHAGLR